MTGTLWRHAIEMLQSHGLERSQLTVLGSSDAVRSRLGLPVAEPTACRRHGSTLGAPIDKSEEQNMTPLLRRRASAYLGAVLAAGVAVASGGTLAGAAVAALLGGAGGGAMGAGAAGLFRGTVEERYAEQLSQGGILLLVQPRSKDDLRTGQDCAGRTWPPRQIETTADRTLT